MDSKSALRIKAKAIRKTLDIKSKSKKAVEKIRASEEYKNAHNILIYYPLKYEINILNLLNDKKNFYLPKVKDLELLVCPYSNRLKLSKYNIKEPCTNPLNPEVLDLIIVPALMTDSNNFRLGYGGGFYDRFLSKYSDTKTLTTTPKELFTNNLPTDEFDKKIDKVILL